MSPQDAAYGRAPNLDLRPASPALTRLCRVRIPISSSVWYWRTHDHRRDRHTTPDGGREWQIWPRPCGKKNPTNFIFCYASRIFVCYKHMKTAHEAHRHSTAYLPLPPEEAAEPCRLRSALAALKPEFPLWKVFSNVSSHEADERCKCKKN